MSVVEARKKFVESQLVNEFDKPIQWLDWWTPASRAINEIEQIVQALINTIRQQGKTLFTGCDCIFDLFHTRNFQALYIAASEKQSQRILEQKFVQPIKKNPALAADAQITKGEVRVPRLNSMVEVVPANKATAPGRSLNKLYLDECREIGDDLFMTLVPMVLATGGKIIMTSTAGSPRGFFYEMVKKPGPNTYVFRSTERINPCVDEKALKIAAEQYKNLLPELYRREFENEFAQLGNEALTRGELDLVIDPDLKPLASSDCWGAFFVDLATKRDLCSINGVAIDDDTDDEHSIYRHAALKWWDPREFASPGVLLDTVAREVKFLAEQFPNFDWYIDARHEGHGFINRMEKEGVELHEYSGTPQSNMALWGRFFEMVRTQRIQLMHDQRLLDELLNLRVQDFAFGRGFRVLDGSSKLHRDLSMSLAGAVYFSTEEDSPEEIGRIITISPHGAGPDKDGGFWIPLC